jgi:hypothetical protein
VTFGASAFSIGSRVVLVNLWHGPAIEMAAPADIFNLKTAKWTESPASSLLTSVMPAASTGSTLVGVNESSFSGPEGSQSAGGAFAFDPLRGTVTLLARPPGSAGEGTALVWTGKILLLWRADIRGKVVMLELSAK